MERLDKIIASQGIYSRKDVKKLVQSKRVTVNDIVVKNSDVKISEVDVIKIDNKALFVKKELYLILNKPEGYVSATKDNRDKTVLELVPKEIYRDGLFPAGRLDKNTTGMMIITTDGEFAHNILSPRKHIEKEYLVTIDINNSNDMVEGFAKGVELIDGACKDAKMEIIDEHVSKVTLREGRYHQIKRMFGCYGAKVVKLHRIRMGNLELPKDLNVGECRELTEEELKLIQER